MCGISRIQKKQFLYYKGYKQPGIGWSLGLWKYSDILKFTHCNTSSLSAEISSMLGLLPWSFTKLQVFFFPEIDAMLQGRISHLCSLKWNILIIGSTKMS